MNWFLDPEKTAKLFDLYGKASERGRRQGKVERKPDEIFISVFGQPMKAHAELKTIFASHAFARVTKHGELAAHIHPYNPKNNLHFSAEPVPVTGVNKWVEEASALVAQGQIVHPRRLIKERMIIGVLTLP